MGKLYLTSSVHTHTNYCDGKNTPEEMVQAAIQFQLKTLGFSGHIYTPADTSYCMTPEKTTLYKNEIATLKAKYQDHLDILCGIEYDPLAPWAETKGYDYTIGSVHAIYGKEDGKLYPVDCSTNILKDCIRYGFGEDSFAMIQEYYTQVLQVAKNHPTFLGHFDLIVKTNTNGILFDENNKKYLDFATEILDACIELDTCFEMNTGAIWRGWRKDPYPDYRLLKHMAQKKARITITADSHQKESLLHNYEICAELAQQAGFEEVFVLTKSGFVPCPLAD